MKDALSRYQARRDQLTRGGATPASLLEGVGDLLRRGERLGVEGAPQALRGLTRGQVEAWLQAQKPDALRAGLLRAAEESMEVALGEAEEAELWRTAALEGLEARDRAESAVRALTEWESLHGALDGEAARVWREFREGLGRLDSALRPKARWFIPLNAHRRAERDVLDTAERSRAWWYSDRADCDDLVAALTSGNGQPGPHLQGCTQCQADLRQSAPVEAPPRRHLSADDLWRLDMGLMSEDERTRTERHTEKCLECAQAVWALEEGDEAIEEALDADELPGAAARPSRGPAPRRTGGARLPEHREVLEERREFRVVLVRERQRARLLVQPLSGRTVTAAVFLTPGKPSLKPHPGPEGILFELGPAGGRSAHLTLQVGGELFERDFSF
jgi:hypothetical protein